MTFSHEAKKKGALCARLKTALYFELAMCHSAHTHSSAAHVRSTHGTRVEPADRPGHRAAAAVERGYSMIAEPMPDRDWT
jgi:hypothetical protein